ncbi:DNA polymerase Y family protein [Leadbettera azotonutricia]|uniref:Putative DNA-directed DNA polymerase n=1 Tax=Leadbettera azotonutricia (strain ATCC BAA-888 / DSM 13862 / ZAS-9) TaxID=545695 RepID=F5Y7N0_LEAAZ|nr:DNA-directed DNA polymerase [Leadbettera azotonutricia]AEF82390.1 putative DNA-directed DNA polymerase [Leadbettera azotonutricia ZAS-9]
MGNISRAVCHLNIIGFRAAVAAQRDTSLRGQPFVIAGATGGRALVLDLSPEAMKEGISPGMALGVAERRVRDLTVLAPDPPAYLTMNRELEKIAALYAPVYENDQFGNLYLDLTGTAGLFGPAADCASRILREMLEQVSIRPAAAVAGNKLICKIATRTIRPTGLIQVQAGAEADFLVHQDLRLLPGMGPGLLRTAAVTGLREIGELAALSDGEAVSLFGKHGRHLRDTARGIDDSPVETVSLGEKRIEKHLDFAEDTLDFDVIRGGLMLLAETGGIEMRGQKWGTAAVLLHIVYADGVRAEGQEKQRRLCITDRDIAAAAERVYLKAVVRRLRIRSITLTLGDLRPLGWSPDLFEIAEDTKQRKLQEAADKVRNKYGPGMLTTAAVYAASRKEPVLSLPSVSNA